MTGSGSTYDGSPDDGRPLVLVVEDDVLVRTTLMYLLDGQRFRALPVADGDEALKVLTAVPGIKAVVTDVEMGGSINGVQLALRVRAEWGIGVVVASGRWSPEHDELPDGIYFVAKPIHRGTLLHLVQEAVGTPAPASSSQSFDADSPPVEITARQREVLELLMQGLANRDIALALDLSENTVRAHLQTIFRILGVSNRAAAILRGQRLLGRQG